MNETEQKSLVGRLGEIEEIISILDSSVENDMSGSALNKSFLPLKGNPEQIAGG